MKRTIQISIIAIAWLLSLNGASAQGVCQCGGGDGQLTLISTTMDGNVVNGTAAEWGAVLNDKDNTMCDSQNTDRDAPVQSTGRDITQFAYTGDNTYLSVFTRRLASSTNNIKLIYYADVNNDGVMKDGEPVIVVRWQGANRSVKVYLASYDAQNWNGDPLTDNAGNADGYTMPGGINGKVNGGQYDYGGTWGASSGTEVEWHVRWSDLGVAPGSDIGWHISSTNTSPGANNIAGKIDDNLGSCAVGGTGSGQVSVGGTVFNDTQADASGSGQGLSGVKVLLFRDGGDGAADGSDDQLVRTTTTDAGGAYSFGGVAGGTYWLAVNSRSGDMTNGNTWPEQTYGPANSLCSDGSGGTAVISSAGACFGGRRGDRSDALPSNASGSSLGSAEHVAKAVLSQSNMTVDFGFSFNVVTTARDGKDDAYGRTIQGSMRQFIWNANAIGSANEMRFVPAVPANQGSWWQVRLTGKLPTITGSDTEVNGTAFALGNAAQKRSMNTASAGVGGTAGVDQHPFSRFPGKDLEIDMAGYSPLTINTSGSIRNLAIFNADRLIEVANGTAVVAGNMIGTRADGTDPGSAVRAGTGVYIVGYNKQEINSNYFAYLKEYGITSAGRPTGDIMRNEFYRTCLDGTKCDAIDMVGVWTVQYNVFHENGSLSSSPEREGAAIEFGQTTTNSVEAQIINNTIVGNATRGISMINAAANSTIAKNIIRDNGGSLPEGKGSGIKIASPEISYGTHRIIITENSIYNNNGLGIDLVDMNSGTNGMEDGINLNDGNNYNWSIPNDGVDYPVFTSVEYDGQQLQLEGYIGLENNKYVNQYTIEVFIAQDDGDAAGNGAVHGEGKTFVGSFTLTPHYSGVFSKTITTSAISGGDYITATHINTNAGTSEFGPNIMVEGPSSNKGLLLEKTVDKGQALPGEVLSYAISYTNESSQPVHSVEIEDDVPAYTTFTSASCGTLPNNLTGCTIDAPPAGETGTVTWTLNGSLAPGASGTLTYTVTIEN